MISGQEYEQYIRRLCLEGLLAGELTAEHARERAGGLDLELDAQGYALAFFAVEPGADRLRDALLGHFLKYPQYILLRWSVGDYLVVIKADADDLDQCIERCICSVRAGYEAYGGADWHVAVSSGAASLEELPGCYEELSRLWAHRYLMPGAHLLTRETVGRSSDEEERLLMLSKMSAGPEQLRQILEHAAPEAVGGLVEELLAGAGEALRSDAFCCYLALGTRFTALRFVEERGGSQQEFIRANGLEFPGGRLHGALLAEHMTRILQAAVRLRDGDAVHACRGVLQQAAAYISTHFTRERLSLEQVASAVDLSPNYLSALFRREMDCTFVEFVTEKRMELARDLLAGTSMRSGEVARAVGYRDPRYFSALFKKTQGMTPREYRSMNKTADG